MGNKDLQLAVPRNVLAKQGLSAAACLGGGAFLMLMNAGTPVLGIILPVVALLIGFGALLSKDRGDKLPGMLFTLGGIMGLVVRFGIPLLKPIAGTGLLLGGLGLIAAGIWKGIKFFKGLKSRG